jgi:hypothetical protein
VLAVLLTLLALLILLATLAGLLLLLLLTTLLAATLLLTTLLAALLLLAGFLVRILILLVHLRSSPANEAPSHRGHSLPSHNARPRRFVPEFPTNGVCHWNL